MLVSSVKTKFGWSYPTCHASGTSVSEALDFLNTTSKGQPYVLYRATDKTHAKAQYHELKEGNYLGVEAPIFWNLNK